MYLSIYLSIHIIYIYIYICKYIVLRAFPTGSLGMMRFVCVHFSGTRFLALGVALYGGSLSPEP